MPFVVFEGIDGSGKSALMESVYWKVVLRYKGLIKVIATAEPWGDWLRLLISKHGEELDKKDFTCLFAADRLAHNLRLIKPHSQAGDLVMCDRYTMSSLAYQSDGSIEDNYRVLWANKKAHIPDATFLLDLPASEAVKRTGKRNEGTSDLFDDMGAAEQEKIRKQYLALPQWLAGTYDNIIKLNALKPLDELTEEVMQHLVEKGYLPSKGGEIIESKE